MMKLSDYDIINLTDDFPKSNSNNDVKTMEEQEADRFGKDTKLRKILAIWTMIIISGWLVCVFLILILCQQLKSDVIITLLATTTMNVLGLPKIILEGLFNHQKKKTKFQNKDLNHSK